MEMTAKKLSVLIADDHETVREGLRLIVDAQPDMEVVGIASNGHDAVVQTASRTPDVVVMDISMPDVNGWTATAQIRERFPSTKVVTLTRHIDTSHFRQLVEAGTSGYVLKQSSSSELVRAIRTVAGGEKYIDPAMARRAQEAELRPVPVTPRGTAAALSPREIEVMRLIAWGYTNKEIASNLKLSVKTVEAHKSNGMRKMGMRGRIDVVRYALLQGWLHEA
jgi:DNA-binding NarL/FixJ family response regulator